MSDVIAADQLRLLIERIERLEEEKKGIADDIKDVYAEAKSTGYDTKTMRAIVRLRRMEKHHRDEAEALLETYKVALGLARSHHPARPKLVEGLLFLLTLGSRKERSSAIPARTVR